MKQYLKFFFTIITTTLVFASCKKNSTDNPNNGGGGNSVDTIGTVYSAGYENSGSGNTGKKIAKYWKDKTATNLTDGTNDAEATAIILVGTDVYTAGYEKNAAGKSVAKYWKNITATNLTDGTNDAVTTAMVLVGTDIYIAGYEKNTANINVAKYWKNGVAVNLSNGLYDAKANAIAIVGADVYVAGNELNTTNIAVAKYWKNGIPVTLSNGTQATFVRGISVVGNDVHVVGNTWDHTAQFSNDPRGIAKYWKNGVLTNLNANGAATAIYTSGNDIYIAGLEDVTPKYWKNGVPINYTFSSSYFNIPTSILVYGSKVYVGGYSDPRGQGAFYTVLGFYNGLFSLEPISSGRFNGKISSIYVVR